jgi:hypothetical protein
MWEGFFFCKRYNIEKISNRIQWFNRLWLYFYSRIQEQYEVIDTQSTELKLGQLSPPPKFRQIWQLIHSLFFLVEIKDEQ